MGKSPRTARKSFGKPRKVTSRRVYPGGPDHRRWSIRSEASQARRTTMNYLKRQAFLRDYFCRQ
jgi:hypothetical protein